MDHISTVNKWIWTLVIKNLCDGRIRYFRNWLQRKSRNDCLIDKKKIGDVEATPAMSSSSRRGVSHSTPRRNAASIESGNALNGVGAAPLPPPTASSRPTSSQSSGATFRRPSKEALSLSLSGASLSSAKKVGSPDSLLLYANALIEFVWLIDWLIDRLRI